MADNTIRTNDIIRGTYGRVWIDGELFANVKSFEAKLTLNYEEVDLSNDLGKHQIGRPDSVRSGKNIIFGSNN